ncbi:MAG: hypothetical protein K0S07_1770, partial [Chlamydiales bacterium]|nr:hypothetical protein [Chlamydiales bacterium]
MIPENSPPRPSRISEAPNQPTHRPSSPIPLIAQTTLNEQQALPSDPNFKRKSVFEEKGGAGDHFNKKQRKNAIADELAEKGKTSKREASQAGLIDKKNKRVETQKVSKYARKKFRLTQETSSKDTLLALSSQYP